LHPSSTALTPVRAVFFSADHPYLGLEDDIYRGSDLEQL
jgi:hypothetical protein